MRNAILLLITVGFGLASCKFGKPNNNKPDVYADTLTYQYKFIKQRADDCGTQPDSTCTVAQIKYPVFDNQPLMNDSIYSGVSTLVDRNKGLAGLQRLVWSFMTDYKNSKKRNSSSKKPFNLDYNAIVVRQDSSLATIQLNGYLFNGGAHGNSITRYINWNTQSRKKLQLNDILKSGYESELNKVAEIIFRKQENLSDTSSLVRDYFFKNGKFSLNNNFLITPVGLHFLYNQDEIKPYAAGQTEVEIPYTQISSLLQPNTVVSRYLQ